RPLLRRRERLRVGGRAGGEGGGREEEGGEEGGEARHGGEGNRREVRLLRAPVRRSTLRERTIRPYDCDRGGTSPEPWHLGHAPVARRCEAAQSCGSLESAPLRPTVVETAAAARAFARSAPAPARSAPAARRAAPYPASVHRL